MLRLLQYDVSVRLACCMEAPSELRSLQSSVFSRGFPGTVVEAPFGRSPMMWRGATEYLLKGRVIA